MKTMSTSNIKCSPTYLRPRESSADDQLNFRGRMYLTILFVFLLSDVLSGILRFSLALIGHEYLIYMPKALVVGALFIEIMRLAVVGEMNRRLFIAAGFYLVASIVGLFAIGNLSQVLFGIFETLPMLFGMIALPTLLRRRHELGMMLALLWLVAAVGVIISLVVTTPWSGFAYQIGQWNVSASKSWTALGISRVAGFSRASYAVAYQLLVLAAPLFICWRRRLFAWCLWLITGGLITATTTKTAVAIFILVTLLIPLMGRRPVSKSLKVGIGRLLPAMVAMSCFLLPFSTLFVNYRISFQSFWGKFLFSSFADRLLVTWPAAFNLVMEHGSYVFGRGMGGIGTPQKYFEPNLYNPADNLFLYGYVTFGVAAVFLIIAFAYKLARLPIQYNSRALTIWVLGVAAVTAGWTVSDINGAFMGTVIGLVFGCSFVRTRKGRSL